MELDTYTWRVNLFSDLKLFPCASLLRLHCVSLALYSAYFGRRLVGSRVRCFQYLLSRTLSYVSPLQLPELGGTAPTELASFIGMTKNLWPLDRSRSRHRRCPLDHYIRKLHAAGFRC